MTTLRRATRPASRSPTMLVARQEFRQTVATKAFWIGLLSLPLIIGLAVAIPILLEGTKDARRYAVLDRSGWVLEAVEARIYRQDLLELGEQVHGLRDGDRRAHARLPEVVRDFGAAWTALGVEQRPALAAALAGEPAALDTVDGPGAAAAREVIEAQRGALRAWWWAVPASELERLGLELSRRRFERVPLPAGADTTAALNAAIADEQLFAYFVIGADPVGGGSETQGQYVSRNLTDRDLRRWFRGHVEEVVRRQRLAREGIAPEVAAWVQAPVRFRERRLDDSGKVEAVETRDKIRQWAPAVFTYVLWIAVFTSAQMLLTSTIEEKSARIMEVLVSSVSPTQLLAGKVIGVAGAGLIVIGVWTGCALVALLSLDQLVGGAAAGLVEVAADPALLLAFAVYFVLGYLLYATYLVGLGSLCSSLKESQNLMWPAMVPLLVALLSLPHVGQDPNGTLARVLSFVPPLTPFVMMNRSAGPPPAWEYAATTALLVAAIWLTVKGAARLFRVGILLTGSRPGVGEVLRLLWSGRPG